MKKYFVSYIYRYKNALGIKVNVPGNAFMDHEDITGKSESEIIKSFEQQLFIEKEKATLRTWNTAIEVVLLSYPHEALHYKAFHYN